MTDYSELKRVAEMATPGEWQAYDTHGKRFIESMIGEAHVVCDTPKKQWLKDSEFIAAANPVTVLALIAEVEALRDAATLSAMRIKELDLLFGRYILAMRAAVIEDEHGKTETTGMDWIFNSLAGPGQLPPEEETDAQAYFDREIVAVDNGIQEVMAFHDQRRKAKSKETGNGQAT